MKKIDRSLKIDKGGRRDDIHDVHLLIELTDKCNHRCIMCKHSWSKTMHAGIPTTFMDMGLFFKLINELKDSRLKVVSIDPLWVGESLMHPRFKEMISYLFAMNKKFGICHGIILNTNACFLDREVTDIFLDYARFVQNYNKQKYYFRIYFSLDAATPQTYAKMRNVSPSAMEKVIHNIHYFMEKRKEQNLMLPNLIFIFIVTRKNKHEAKKFLEYWKRYLEGLSLNYEVSPTWPVATDRDAIYFRQLICPDIEKAISLHRSVCASLGLIPKDKLPRKKNQKSKSKKISNKEKARRICAAPWRTPNIQASGVVTPCCRDVELTLNLGNIKESSIDELWFGEKIKDIRQAHISGDLSQYPVCLSCAEPEGEISEEDTSLLDTQDRF